MSASTLPIHMNPSSLDCATRQVAIASISGYQRYISPHKGFACAHRLLHGGKSCSGYVKQMIEQEGLLAALKASRKRFQACREANQILRARCISKAQVSNERDPSKRKSSPNYSNCTWEACGQGSTEGCGQACQAGLDAVNCTSGIDCGGLDCGECGSGIDCGPGVDCSGADCGSGIDCGSCG